MVRSSVDSMWPQASANSAKISARMLVSASSALPPISRLAPKLSWGARYHQQGGNANPAGLPDQLLWNTSVRSSMLSRGAASAGVVGSVKAVCGPNRVRPSVAES